MANKKLLIGIGLGVVALGIGGYAFYKSRKNASEKLDDAIFDENDIPSRDADSISTLKGQETSLKEGYPTNRPTTQPTVEQAVPAPTPTKGDTIDTWRADKSRIKSICGRRRIFGQAKRDWLACVNREGGNTSDSYYNMDGFESGNNEMEVGLGLTDLF